MRNCCQNKPNEVGVNWSIFALFYFYGFNPWWPKDDQRYQKHISKAGICFSKYFRLGILEVEILPPLPPPRI